MPEQSRRCFLCARSSRIAKSRLMTIDCLEQERRIRSGYSRRHNREIVGPVLGMSAHRDCYRSIIRTETLALTRSNSNPRKYSWHRNNKQSRDPNPSTWPSQVLPPTSFDQNVVPVPVRSIRFESHHDQEVNKESEESGPRGNNLAFSRTILCDQTLIVRRCFNMNYLVVHLNLVARLHSPILQIYVLRRPCRSPTSIHRVRACHSICLTLGSVLMMETIRSRSTVPAQERTFHSMTISIRCVAPPTFHLRFQVISIRTVRVRRRTMTIGCRTRRLIFIMHR